MITVDPANLSDPEEGGPDDYGVTRSIPPAVRTLPGIGLKMSTRVRLVYIPRILRSGFFVYVYGKSSYYWEDKPFNS